MRMNRRNVLAGLGTIVAGGGAALGTGAFSSVEANRSVSASIKADDNGAYLGFSVNNSNIASISSNEISVSVSKLNQDAKTSFDAVFTIDNNGPDGVGIKITPYDSSDSVISDGSLTFESVANTDDLTAYPSAPGDDHNLDADGGSDETVTVGITFDDIAGDPTALSYVTVSADKSKYQS